MKVKMRKVLQFMLPHLKVGTTFCMVVILSLVGLASVVLLVGTTPFWERALGLLGLGMVGTGISLIAAWITDWLD